MINEIVVSDCINFLQCIKDETVDSCVTDPPYGLNFMGKKWDSFKNHKLMQDFHFNWAKALFRVLKPGSYILVFSGTRTYHRLASAFEDAGFEIRDMLAWIYGTGFPKGQNISKAIDKKHGLDGTTGIPKQTARSIERGYYETTRTDLSIQGGRFADPTREKRNGDIKTHYLPVSPEAIRWNGWNTALKPAQEPILLARKPLGEKTIVDNVLAHGTGAINIDGCRVATNPDVDDMHRTVDRQERETATWREGSGFKNEQNEFTGVLPEGRYPANVILSHHPDCELVQEGITEAWARDRNEGQSTGKHGIYGNRERPSIEVEYKEAVPEIWKCVPDCPIRMMNEQSGDSKGRTSFMASWQRFTHDGWKRPAHEDYMKTPQGYNDSGGAARFFYCAKAYKGERNAGLGYYLDCELVAINDDAEYILNTTPFETILFEDLEHQSMFIESELELDLRFVKKEVRNPHITVKPIELISYLVRMITPKGGTVIDPFVGSGTTAIAAMLEQVDFLACDISAEYVDIAKKRFAYWIDKKNLRFKPRKKKHLATIGQETLDVFFLDN